MGHEDHPVGIALRECIEALVQKRKAAHEVRNASQILKCRLSITMVALLGRESMNRSESENFAQVEQILGGQYDRREEKAG